ncbi:hypothetical protein BESB_048400 [Besnoitia besnoiti]|uniref:Uncharacterized protein n=1 Tax=Besnoitia besnoiti TaxID=94643 RepID=A0A2A9MDR9_BESBE|nr:hypothetical protein BESB_048400 [Besnoitia besnoiti]PFH36648.1 hypothetical protein BESB_048400 [Besnoitia besnoiti]
MALSNPCPGPYVSSSHDAYSCPQGLNIAAAPAYPTLGLPPTFVSSSVASLIPSVQSQAVCAGCSAGSAGGSHVRHADGSGLMGTGYTLHVPAYAAITPDRIAQPYAGGPPSYVLGPVYPPQPVFPQNLFSADMYRSGCAGNATSLAELQARNPSQCEGGPEACASLNLVSDNRACQPLEQQKSNASSAEPTAESTRAEHPITGSVASENFLPASIEGEHRELLPFSAPVPASYIEGRGGERKASAGQTAREKRRYREFLQAQIALRKERDRAERARELGVDFLPETKQHRPGLQGGTGDSSTNGKSAELQAETDAGIRRAFLGRRGSTPNHDTFKQMAQAPPTTDRLKQQKEYGEFLKRQAEQKRLERERAKDEEVAEDKRILEIARQMELSSSHSYRLPQTSQSRQRTRDLRLAAERTTIPGEPLVTGIQEGRDRSADHCAKQASSPPDGDICHSRSVPSDKRNGCSAPSSRQAEDPRGETLSLGGRRMEDALSQPKQALMSREGLDETRGGAEEQWRQKLIRRQLYQQALAEQIREKEARKEEEKQKRLKEQAEERRLMDEALEQEKRMPRTGRKHVRTSDEDADAFGLPRPSDGPPCQLSKGVNGFAASAATTVAVTPPPETMPSRDAAGRPSAVPDGPEGFEKPPPSSAGACTISPWVEATDKKSASCAVDGGHFPCGFTDHTLGYCRRYAVRCMGRCVGPGSPCQRMRDFTSCRPNTKSGEADTLDIVGLDLEAVRAEIKRQQDELRSMQLQQQLAQLQQRLQQDELNRALFGLLESRNVLLPSNGGHSSGASESESGVPVAARPQPPPLDISAVLRLEQRGAKLPDNRQEALARSVLQVAHGLTGGSLQPDATHQPTEKDVPASQATETALGGCLLRLLTPFFTHVLGDQRERVEKAEAPIEDRGGSPNAREDDPKAEAAEVHHGGRTSRGRSELSVRLEPPNSLSKEKERGGSERQRKAWSSSPPVPAIRASERQRGIRGGEAASARASSRNSDRSHGEGFDCGGVRSHFLRIDEVIDGFEKALETEAGGRQSRLGGTSRALSPPPSPACSLCCSHRQDAPNASCGMSLCTDYSLAFGDATASLALRIASATPSKKLDRCEGCPDWSCTRGERCASCDTDDSEESGINLEKLPQAMRRRFLSIRALDNLAARTFCVEDDSGTALGSEGDSICEPALPPVPAGSPSDFLRFIPLNYPSGMPRRAHSLSPLSRGLRLGIAPPVSSPGSGEAGASRRGGKKRGADKEPSKTPGKLFLALLQKRRAQTERLQRMKEPLRRKDRFRGRLTWDADIMHAFSRDLGSGLDAVANALAEAPQEETKDTKHDTEEKKLRRWSILRRAAKLSHRLSRKRISFAPDTIAAREQLVEESERGKNDTTVEDENENSQQPVPKASEN